MLTHSQSPVLQLQPFKSIFMDACKQNLSKILEWLLLTLLQWCHKPSTKFGYNMSFYNGLVTPVVLFTFSLISGLNFATDWTAETSWSLNKQQIVDKCTIQLGLTHRTLKLLGLDRLVSSYKFKQVSQKIYTYCNMILGPGRPLSDPKVQGSSPWPLFWWLNNVWHWL